MRMLVPVVILVCAGSAAAAAAAGVPAGLAAHRAIYDLSLKNARDSSGIEDVDGRMVYEFVGSACEGYTVSFRFVTEINTGEDLRLTDQQTTTYEDIRTRRFDFSTRSYIDRELDHEVRGKAGISEGDVSVHLEEPEKKDMDIGSALFPTEHMIELIDKAKAGETFYQSRIYDGSDAADRAMLTTTVIGAPRTAKAGKGHLDELSGENFWPVAISYFDEEAEGDQMPKYFTTFKLYENGVTQDLTMDYGDFVLEGRLAELELIEREPCAG